MAIRKEMDSTRTFWNNSPCGAHGSLSERIQNRYSLEPWVRLLISEIATRHNDIVEIGCGQGTDGYLFCSLFDKKGRYRGLDYSDASLEIAEASRKQADELFQLNVTPNFSPGDAENLPFEDNSVSCIYSNGVLHHTANPGKAYDEVFRVLKPGGEAYICLYKKPSLKVGIAKGLRQLQKSVDRLLGTDRFMYSFFRDKGSSPVFGTMMLECFGVPYMAWYSKPEIEGQFKKFKILSCVPVGENFPVPAQAKHIASKFGYMWLIHVRKP